tara:strand:- start:51 stop:317 length:267 start_codon:yes stop_codon:yes gene_type:complete
LHLHLILVLDPEINHSASRMQWFNDLVREVAGEDEPTVTVELFDSGPQGQLNITSGVVCLIDNNDLVGAARGQRDSASKCTHLLSNGV